MNIEISNHAFKWTKDYDGETKQNHSGRFRLISRIFRHIQECSGIKAYSEPYQTSTISHFKKIVTAIVVFAN